MGLVCTKCPCGVKIRAGRLVRATWLIEDYTRAIVVETSFLLGPVASRSYLPMLYRNARACWGRGRVEWPIVSSTFLFSGRNR